jgi:hypothetical protein
MAAVAEVCQTISTAAGVPLRLVEYLARRLGEAGQLPRGPRGRHAPHFEAIHIARLLAAIMVVADGIDFTGASVLLAMTRIEALNQGGEGRVDVYVDGDLDDPQSKMMVVPAGSFLDLVAHSIRWTRSGVSKGGPSAIGLTFGVGSVYGWIEFNLGETGVNHVADIRRVDFGVTEDLLKSGMKQEVRVERDVLFRLGELLGDIPLGPHGGFDLRPPSSTSSETTTPATGGAGPASVDSTKVKTKASQPGCPPVKPKTIATDVSEDVDQDVNQEDSDEKKRGQSPHPFSSLGSPSSDRSNQRKDEPPWPISNSQTQSAG